MRKHNLRHKKKLFCCMWTNASSAVALAARLKALGVTSIMGERNPKPGDNWDRRYECLKFHIPTSFCKLPYMSK